MAPVPGASGVESTEAPITEPPEPIKKAVPALPKAVPLDEEGAGEPAKKGSDKNIEMAPDQVEETDESEPAAARPKSKPDATAADAETEEEDEAAIAKKKRKFPRRTEYLADDGEIA